MKYSKDGLALTQQFESCKLEAYQDVKGVWTIGWGHTGVLVVPGLKCTQAQADAWLVEDTAAAERAVNRFVVVNINQHEFDALVDFAFNCGISAFANSTLLKLLNSGNIHGAAEEFEKWDHASGKVVAGLLRRRLAEKKEFLS